MVSEEKFVSPPIRLDLGLKGLKFDQARIKFSGIDQAGPSFEGRVFVNNPGADLHTPLTVENGYAGSFHVYGYGIWPEDVGKNPRERLPKPGPARAPIEKTVMATEAVRAAAVQSSEVRITVVPVYPGSTPRPASDALKLSKAEIMVE
jgi:hypothetical protein